MQSRRSNSEAHQFFAMFAVFFGAIGRRDSGIDARYLP